MNAKQFQISIFFKDGKPCMMIEHDSVEMLEALKVLILRWIN